MENSSESNVANGTPSTPEEAPTSDTAPPGDSVTKPVNPLRLARPLEKSPAGLTKTTFPSGRPLPMPTINPLCPPGSNQGKNGLKSSPTPPASKSKADGSEESNTDLEKESDSSRNEPTENKEIKDATEPETAEDLDNKNKTEQTETAEENLKEETERNDNPTPSKDDQVTEDKPEKAASSQENTAETSEQSKVDPDSPKKSQEKKSSRFNCEITANKKRLAFRK